MTYTGVSPACPQDRRLPASRVETDACFVPTIRCMIPHPIPCKKTIVDTDTIGRPVWRLPLDCYVANHLRLSEGHWLWTGPHHVTGYGAASVRGQKWLAHRLVYEHLVGPIPPGHEVDHLCKVVACCNPSHLEAVTPRVNKQRSDTPWGIIARTGKCQRGHDWTPETTYSDPARNLSYCKKCAADRSARRYRRQAGAA